MARKNAYRGPVAVNYFVSSGDLEARFEKLFGKHWRRVLGTGTGISATTMSRWLSGKCAISPVIVALLEALEALKEHDAPFPSGYDTQIKETRGGKRQIALVE